MQLANNPQNQQNKEDNSLLFKDLIPVMDSNLKITIIDTTVKINLRDNPCNCGGYDWEFKRISLDMGDINISKYLNYQVKKIYVNKENDTLCIDLWRD